MTKRVVLTVLGAVLLIVGVCLAVAGGAVMAITGSDNTLETGPQRLTTATTALVTEVADISGTGGAANTFGQPDLQLVLSGTPKATFVGVGPADAVDRYLAGAPVEQVNDFELDPFRLKSTLVAGSASPAAPDAQPFWVARGTGPNPQLTWKITDGRYRLVLMNADASPGVVSDARVDLRVPHLFAIGVSILVAGLVFLLVGVLLLVLGLRSRRSPRYAGGAPPPMWSDPAAQPAGPPHQGPPPEQEHRPQTAKNLGPPRN
jgi:hypothetical protein